MTDPVAVVGGPAPTSTVIGLAAGHTRRDDVEHALDVLAARLGSVELACTHVIEGRWAGSVQLTDPAATADLDALAAELGAALSGPGGVAGDPAWRDAAARAAAGLRTRSDGRAVHFPGQAALVGEVPCDDVPTLSAIDVVVGIAGTPTAGTTLVTREHVRPELGEGRLVLTVRPFGADGAVAPFEVPDPTPCCAAHG